MAIEYMDMCGAVNNGSGALSKKGGMVTFSKALADAEVEKMTAHFAAIKAANESANTQSSIDKRIEQIAICDNALSTLKEQAEL